MALSVNGGMARSLLGRLATVCLFGGILLLALMSGLVVLQVICRNLFDLGLPWADELARFCGVALVYLAVPVLALRGQLIAVDLVANSVGETPKRMLRTLNELAVFAFCALSLYGFQAFLARAAKFSTSAMKMPNWIFYAPALIGIVLLGLVSFLRLVEALRGEIPVDEASKVL